MNLQYRTIRCRSKSAFGATVSPAFPVTRPPHHKGLRPAPQSAVWGPCFLSPTRAARQITTMSRLRRKHHLDQASFCYVRRQTANASGFQIVIAQPLGEGIILHLVVSIVHSEHQIHLLQPA
jgi:hypothetical protein